MAAHGRVRSPESTENIRATALIVADLSNEASYGEYLYETFGSAGDRRADQRHGDGNQFERRPVRPRRDVGLHGRTNLSDRVLPQPGGDRHRVRMAKGADERTRLLPSWSISRRSCARAARSTRPCRASTMISPSRAACWLARAATPTCNVGYKSPLRTGTRRRHRQTRGIRGPRSPDHGHQATPERVPSSGLRANRMTGLAADAAARLGHVRLPQS